MKVVLKSQKKETNTAKDKILIQIGEQRKGWLAAVAQLSNKPVAEIVRVLVDEASIQDPENFVIKMEKFALKSRLEDLEKQEARIQAEREELHRAMENRQSVSVEQS